MTSQIFTTIRHKISFTDAIAVVSWGVASAVVLARALFHGDFPGLSEYGILLGFGIVSGAVLADFRKTIIGFFAAGAIGLTILFILATMSALTGTVPPPGDQTVYALWLTIIFKAIFPFAFMVSLIASLVGAGIGETYF